MGCWRGWTRDAQPAERRRAAEQPLQLRVLPHMALHKHHALLWVDPTGHVGGDRLPRLLSKRPGVTSTPYNGPILAAETITVQWAAGSHVEKAQKLQLCDGQLSAMFGLMWGALWVVAGGSCQGV